MFDPEISAQAKWTSSDGMSSARIATLPTDHLDQDFVVFAEKHLDEDGVTSMVALGRVQDGTVLEPFGMDPEVARSLAMALMLAADQAEGVRRTA